MNETFGFIGTGNMGGAMAKAAACSMDPKNIYLANRTAAKAQTLAQTLGSQTATNEYIAESCGYIFLGVKPQGMADLLASLAPILKKRKDGFVLVSMAAAISIRDIRVMAGGDYPVIRTAPNTPVSVGCGVILYDISENVTAEMENRFLENMRGGGMLDRLPEALMDVGSVVAGCGSAFACMFVEALADGGVACGMPRQKAVQYAAQMLMGTAKLVLESGKHPEQLKDEVCSPGGSTITGVHALEKGGMRAAAIDAVRAAYDRTVKLKG